MGRSLTGYHAAARCDLSGVVDGNAAKEEKGPFRSALVGIARVLATSCESHVKQRCELSIGTSGVEVFKKAFRGSGAILTWRGVANSEIDGRAKMFEAAFMAYRNPRAHREESGGEARAYREFYVANELFLLEAEAVES